MNISSELNEAQKRDSDFRDILAFIQTFPVEKAAEGCYRRILSWRERVWEAERREAKARAGALREAVAAIDKRIALSEPGSDRLSLTYLRREIVAMAREEA